MVPGTFNMSLVRVGESNYGRLKAWFIGTLPLAVAEDGIHLATLASYVPLFKLIFPSLCIPWQFVKSAGSFEAPGWVQVGTASAAILQATYDPGCKGQFLELEVGEPPMFLQMSADLLGDKVNRLPPARDSKLQ